ncbi:MAG: hypothetical protein QM484_04600 [Woeseiaceae bacterium]
MLDYILFNEKPFQLFTDWLKNKGVECEVSMLDEDYVIKVSEDLDDDLLEAIDDKYEEFMGMSQAIIDAEEKDKHKHDGHHMAGILVTLKDGSVSYADIDSNLLSRVISVISPEELGEIVTAIADAVEYPQPKTYCQRQREER